MGSHATVLPSAESGYLRRGDGGRAGETEVKSLVQVTAEVINLEEVVQRVAYSSKLEVSLAPLTSGWIGACTAAQGAAQSLPALGSLSEAER